VNGRRAVCAHWDPTARHGCRGGHIAPLDCPECIAYRDGSREMCRCHQRTDMERVRTWNRMEEANQ
jgi:hypothetical protein